VLGRLQYQGRPEVYIRLPDSSAQWAGATQSTSTSTSAATTYADAATGTATSSSTTGTARATSDSSCELHGAPLADCQVPERRPSVSLCLGQPNALYGVAHSDRRT
jgi:hypothetical protein